jgi:acetylglutamate synthase
VEFEPSPKYLLSLLSPVGGEEEAKKIVDKATQSAGLPKKLMYEIDDFIKICEALRAEGGRVGVMGMNGITQARCYKVMNLLTLKKR